jgi:uncharacterized membrane protein YfcA
MTLLTDPHFWLLAVIAVTALGLSKGGFGGVGMIAAPLLSLVLPPLQAAAIMIPIMIVQDTISIWVYRRDWSAWNLKVMLAGSVFGVAAAGIGAAYLTDAQVRLAVGAIGVVFVLYSWLARVPTVARRPSAVSGAFWGGLAAFTSTIAQAGAPPFYVHILPQKLDKMTLVGTALIFFALINWMKLVPFMVLGQFSAETLTASIALLPLAIATNFAGIWLVRRMPTELFYKVAYVLVFLISLELMRQGLVTVVRGWI